MNIQYGTVEYFEASLPEYFQYLVDHFFKILPMKEQGEDTVYAYMDSLQFELLGFSELFTDAKYSANVVTLLSILQRLIDKKDCKISVVRREVFHAISICNKLIQAYSE